MCSCGRPDLGSKEGASELSGFEKGGMLTCSHKTSIEVSLARP